VQWTRSGGRIELAQAIKRLIGVSVLRPVLAKRAEVIVQRTVFLNHENDVIDLLESLRRCRLRVLSPGARPAANTANENEKMSQSHGISPMYGEDGFTWR
jgi:hypothetical protein